ncbi:MAG: hypothetical protein MK197_06595 [Candidatus Poseidoniaceae archaeon]|nr:hypothetical protein [Euryarchaeota archaeon]MCH2435938.1 hypothetical protein [Candidatus Poseidoniaceae archaeon]|tara:strand:- start:459 stop:1616 length:1158 start_codon:yes stop_codon:yes gene_type:complete
MASSLDVGNLLWAIGILALPVILALPAKLLYQTVILGVGPAERNYRATVQKILDSGMQVEHFREVLDEESRRLGIKASRAKLNETDMLYPLTITHFLLVPMVFILPIVAIATLPIIILGIPVLYLLEVLLIRRKLLINAIKLLETWFGKQIIHVPDAGNDHCSNDAKVLDASNIAVHFHKVPRVVFLGLFSWLIIHWTLRLDSLMTEFILAGLFYVLLLGIVGIVATALESNLVLVDPARGRIIPIADWLDSMLTPIVGVGLLFLLGRDLMTEARDDGNTILFAATVLMVLYCATAVGVTFQWGYAWWQGKTIRKQFEQQAIEKLNPQSYDLTRNRGRIQLNVRCPMSERIEGGIGPGATLTFTDLDNLPTAHEGVLKSPENPLD